MANKMIDALREYSICRHRAELTRMVARTTRAFVKSCAPFRAKGYFFLWLDINSVVDVLNA